MITNKRREYFVNYRKNNREKFNLASRKYRETHPEYAEKIKKIVYSWRKKNPDKIREYNKKYNAKRISNPKFDNKYQQERWRRLRLKCLKHYSGEIPHCVCCGEKEIKFLSFDHISGGGNKHRKEIKCTNLQWIIKNNFPPIFQILCHNCNMAKGFYGECPHKFSPTVLKSV